MFEASISKIVTKPSRLFLFANVSYLSQKHVTPSFAFYPNQKHVITCGRWVTCTYEQSLQNSCLFLVRPSKMYEQSETPICVSKTKQALLFLVCPITMYERWTKLNEYSNSLSM